MRKKLELFFIVLFLVTGCSLESKLINLHDDFIKNELLYREQYKLMLGLKEELGINGVQISDQILFNRISGYQINLEEAISTWPTSEARLKRVVDIAHELNIQYTSVDTKQSYWIIKDGGGVLGSDFGFLILLEEKIDYYKSRLHGMKPIVNHNDAFSIVY